MDLFEKFKTNMGPLGQYAKQMQGYFMFPKLEGQIETHMKFRGKDMLVWSLNNYLGLANHPEIREIDAQAAKEWGLAYPMGARSMTGHTTHHEELEHSLAEFVSKRDSYLMYYGYPGMVSIIDALLNRKDVVVYDVDAHACIIDGVRLHMGKRFVYEHNNIESCEKQLQRATKITEETGGGILVISEGVYGMAGDVGKINEIAALKSKYNFRFMVDDAHGFGTMGKTGAGTGEHFGVQDKIDLYFATFAKSMATIGAFVAGEEEVIQFLRYNLRSQFYAKSLPLAMVIGAKKRLEMIRTRPELREKLWSITNALQSGLKAAGFSLGNANSCVTPVHLKAEVNEAGSVVIDIREKYNIFCSAVMYPVIPKGHIVLRLIPTAIHTLEDVEYTIKAFIEVKKKLDSGEYARNPIANLELE